MAEAQHRPGAITDPEALNRESARRSCITHRCWNWSVLSSPSTIALIGTTHRTKIARSAWRLPLCAIR
jgi:hypothetical protein